MSDKKKNVIILCSDEMRGDVTGFMGNPDVKTPNLDAFAKKGVVFENHFTCHGKCVPSRIAMMTGRYSHTDGFRNIDYHLPESDPNVVSVLKDEGYQTAVFGKNHCWETLFKSNEVGQSYVDYHSWTGFYEDMFKKREAELKEEVDSVPAKGLDLEKQYFHYRGNFPTQFRDQIYTEQAIDFLKETRDKDRPFFLEVNIEAPHPGYGVDEPYYSMYDRKSISPWPYDLPEKASLPLQKMREVRTGAAVTEEICREIQAVYYGMVSKVDRHIGDILAAVEAEGLLEDTIILFWVDHGDFAGQYGLVEKWDTAMNDCILHVPQILFAPGLPAGKRISALTEHTDLAPTVLELLGLSPSWGIHGSSLLPVIAGEVSRTAVFADGGHENEMIQRSQKPEFKENLLARDGKQQVYARYPDTMARTKMVRTEKYKLIVRLSGGNELYDMENDPYELKNLYGAVEYDHVVQDLQLKMIEWCLRTDTDRPYQEKIGA